MIAALCLSSASLAQNVPQIFECNGGVVSDKETAIRIAEAILFQSMERMPSVGSGLIKSL